jgi:hypothetical protein
MTPPIERAPESSSWPRQIGQRRRYVKWSLLETALGPLRVVTIRFTVPFVPAGDTAVIEVADLTAKLIALFEPNLTVLTSLKLVPVMFTEVPPPGGPFLGDSFLTVGGGPATGTLIRPTQCTTVSEKFEKVEARTGEAPPMPWYEVNHMAPSGQAVMCCGYKMPGSV